MKRNPLVLAPLAAFVAAMIAASVAVWVAETWSLSLQLGAHAVLLLFMAGIIDVLTDGLECERCKVYRFEISRLRLEIASLKGGES